MFRNILVPVDGSKLGERALVLAVPLADQHGAKLTLVSVHEPIMPLVRGGGAPVREPALDSKWRDDHREYLTKLAKRVGRRTTAEVEPVFLDGKVVPTLAAYAANHGVDLVVMVTHGRGGFQRLWLGSVADGLSRRISVPLLLARGGRSPGSRMLQDPLFRRVLVPLDGSDRAETALRTAAALLGDGPGAITLAHIVHPLSVAATANRVPQMESDVEVSYLSPLAARYKRDRITVDVVSKVHGTVPRALLEIADEHDVDLIAITSQGMGTLERMVVGSVADKLVRTARVPVLICPAPGV